MPDPNFHRWSPELRRAVIAVRPEFFGWPVEAQNRYGAKLPHEDRTAILERLLASLAPDAPVEALIGQEHDARLPLELQHLLNEQLQPLIGIGEDAFYLNEHLPEGRSVLDFPTLRAFDEQDHSFQESARASENPTYVPQPYLGALYGCWARVLAGNRLTYLTLSMAADHLYDKISAAASDEIQRLIPHRYISGPDDGKHEGGLIRWDMRIDAGGQEGLLEELRHRVRDYEQQRWAALRTEYDALGRRGVYTIDTSELRESSRSIVFSDKEVLGDIRFETFMADCRRHERDITELQAAAAAQIDRVRLFIAEQYGDLKRHFDPKITRLRKRYKVLMHPDALRDLENLE